MGKHKIAITLDEKLIEFLNKVAPNNRSEYINNVLKDHEQQILKQELIKAIQDDVKEANYQQEIADWDTVVGDGIDG